jgi:hypothetical protein
MKKNVASQKIGAQLISASDGSAFTGAVTVYVTGDAGTQAVGSVGSGACTHEGNGYHTYAPAQAETNYDLIAFTFIGTGAIPVTVQIFTSFPQTGDSYVEVTNGTYGLSAIETLVDGVESTLATMPTNASIADAVWDEATVGHTTAGTFGEQVKTDIDAILDDTGTSGVVVAAGSKTGYAIGTGGITSASFAAGAIDAAAIAADAITSSELAQSAAQEIADEILDRNLAGGGSGNTRNVRNALRALRNKQAIAAGTLTVYQEDDTTSAWTAAVTTTAGDPISAIDPA